MTGSLLASVRVIIGLVSLTAGALKLFQRSDATAGLSKLLGISRSAGRLLNFGLAVVEIAIGGSLVAGLFLPVMLPAAAAMFAGFGVTVLILLRQGRGGHSCGCMGKTGRIGGALAAQDFGLSLLALAVWGRDYSAHPTFTFVIGLGILLFLAPAARRLWSWRQTRGVRLAHATELVQR